MTQKQLVQNLWMPLDGDDVIDLCDWLITPLCSRVVLTIAERKKLYLTEAQKRKKMNRPCVEPAPLRLVQMY